MRRNTAQRMTIKKVFRQINRPLSVDEILKHGGKLVESLNQSTVYRNLKLLVDEGWLERISHPALGTLYERAGKGHHHHFHCRKCKCVFELPGCALKDEGIAPDGYIVEDHEIFLFGICPSCAAKK